MPFTPVDNDWPKLSMWIMSDKNLNFRVLLSPLLKTDGDFISPVIIDVDVTSPSDVSPDTDSEFSSVFPAARVPSSFIAKHNC